MILLDTNVITEPLRKIVDANVLAWIDAQNIETLYLAAISLAELRLGVAALPEGKRKDVLHYGVEQRIVPSFSGRILPFDEHASAAYAELMSRARSAGKTLGLSDGYIAAIAASNGMSVASRDTAPFQAAGLLVINPWNANFR